MTTYFVTAKRFQRIEDGSLMVADKRVLIGLPHNEADVAYKRFVRNGDGSRNDYWHEVQMKVDTFRLDEDTYWDQRYQTHMDGVDHH